MESGKNGETERLESCMKGLILGLLEANKIISPFLPEVSEKIARIFTDPITPPEQPLFPKDR